MRDAATQQELTLRTTVGHVAERAGTRARRGAYWKSARLVVDGSMLGAAAIAAQLGAGAAGVQATSLTWLLVFALVALGTLFMRGAYMTRLRLESLDEVRHAALATTLAFMTVVTARVLIERQPDLVLHDLRMFAFAAVYVAAGRVAMTWSENSARRDGESARTTLVLGAGKIGRLAAKRLLDQPELGLRPIGYLDANPLEDVDDPTGLPVLGSEDDVEAVVRRYGVDHVVVSFSSAPLEVLMDAVKRCEELGVRVCFVPRLYESVSHRVSVEHLGGLPLMSAEKPDPKGWQFAVKYALDRVGAAMLLALAAPVLGATALAVWLSMGRPIFFRQERVGLDGHRFGMLKFRSMKGTPQQGGEADAAWAAQQLAGANQAAGVAVEDRRTPVGRLIRKLSIDELPQLWNVLVGDMSLVGPRPERTSYVRRFEDSVYRYAERHRVKSGITGWAQVCGLRGKTSLADRVEWDNYYIENWSLWLDVKIMFMTLLKFKGE